MNSILKALTSTFTQTTSGFLWSSLLHSAPSQKQNNSVQVTHEPPHTPQACSAADWGAFAFAVASADGEHALPPCRKAAVPCTLQAGPEALSHTPVHTHTPLWPFAWVTRQGDTKLLLRADPILPAAFSAIGQLDSLLGSYAPGLSC